jgi:hypothetical protein
MVGLALAVLLCTVPAVLQGLAQNAAPLLHPQAPTIAALSASGMQRGTTVEIVLTGTNLATPVAVQASFPGAIAIPDDNGNGQDGATLRVRLEVPVDAPIGFHTLRLCTTRGISNMRLFCIDDLPESPLSSTNRDKSTPQVVTFPCVVPGNLAADKSAWFLVNVKAGQRLSFDLLGRRLGGPIDPEITLYDPKTFRELAHDNDSPGCQTDCRLRYEFKESGDYLIEVRDVLNRGGKEYAFRLRIGDFSLATVTLPLAIQHGKTAAVQFAGPAVDGAAPITVVAPKSLEVDTVWVVPVGPTGLSGWPVAVAITDLPESLETPDNHSPESAMRLAVPSAVSGRFAKSDETHFYRIAANKGQKLTIAAQTLELGSPALVKLAVRNEKTKANIARSNPQATPPGDQRLEITAPEEGTYLLEIQHLNYLGGHSEAFRFTLVPTRPSFEVTIGADRFDLSAPGFAILPLQLQRSGYDGPVEVKVAGPKGLTGKCTILAGKTTAPLVVKADDHVAMGPYHLTLVAEATIGKQRVRRLVNLKTVVSQSLGGLHLPPRQLFSQIAVGVREAAPFQLSATLDRPAVVAGSPANFTVIARREPLFDGEIVLTLPAGLPAGVTAPTAMTIGKGQTELKVPLSIGEKADLGEFAVIFAGTGKQDTNQFATIAAPVTVTIEKK